MKKLTEYDRIACYLDSLFQLLNEKYFESALSKAVITIQSTPGAYGHFTCGKVWRMTDGDEATERYEINLGAATLARPIEETVATLLHEMIHYYCQVNGIQDTSRSGTYHNKRFKTEAEKRGLVIKHHEKYGWTITTPSDDLTLWCAEMGLRDICLARVSFGASSLGGGSSSGAGKRGKSSGSSSTRKYICPDCGMSVRATRDLTAKLLCVDCKKLLMLA